MWDFAPSFFGIVDKGQHLYLALGGRGWFRLVHTRVIPSWRKRMHISAPKIVPGVQLNLVKEPADALPSSGPIAGLTNRLRKARSRLPGYIARSMPWGLLRCETSC